MEIYIVKSGDTISKIASAFRVSEQRLMADNGLDPNTPLAIGQALIILKPAVTYVIQSGDSLYSVAQKYSTTTDALLRNNPWLTSEQTLMPGRTITIRFTAVPTRYARINGYAYPFISPALLRRELPFLSTLTVFGYGFDTTGKLIPPDDTFLLSAAKSAGVAPVLLLSSITETGNFSSDRAHLLFSNKQLQETVLYEIAGIMGQKGYRGLDIDFEYVLPEDASDFLEFVDNAQRIMHSYGYFVNVDLAPKASANQRGLLYEAHDYKALGELADTVLLMTYEWGYTYGPPMAVAPIGPVTGVVDYAVTQINTQKILLGVPNYGYDWILPFQKGITRATTLGNQYATVVAAQNGAEIQYDDVSQSPWFGYERNGVEHVVWFEDVRSINAKLELMSSRQLAGAGYWNLMRPFAQNWALLSTSFIPQKI